MQLSHRSTSIWRGCGSGRSSTRQLGPDALKNTNLKIIHRVVAGDDREILSQAIGLDGPQNKHLINLARGEKAVVFFESLIEPILVEVQKSKIDQDVKDEEIFLHMQKFYPELLPKGPVRKKDLFLDATNAKTNATCVFLSSPS